MREYYVLQTEFWINPQYTSFSLRAQLIAMYLMGCPHTYRKAGLRRAIQELVEADFLSPDYKQGWKLIHFFKEEDKTVDKREGFSRNMAQYCKDV